MHSVVARTVAAILTASNLLIQSSFGAGHVDEERLKLLPITEETEAQAAKALAGVVPNGKSVEGNVNKNGVYTLSGDFFNICHHYATLDTDPILICRWENGQWKAVSALNDAAAWRFPNWETERPGREPVATKPFWMIYLDNKPLLVIASGVEKAGQNYDIILLERDFKGISDVADSISAFAGTPVVKDGYLVTEDESRVKAEWGILKFSQIVDGKLVVKKSWEDVAPYNRQGREEEEVGQPVQWQVATSNGISYTVMDDEPKATPPADAVIYLGGGGSRNSKPFAKVFLSPKSKDPSLISNLPEEELAYLFEKLLGIPRELYKLDSEWRPTGKLEEHANIKITGSPEAVKLLSPKSHPRSAAKR